MSNYPAGVTGNEPTFGDDGYSDFSLEYAPDREQLESYFADRFSDLLTFLSTQYRPAYMGIMELWKEANEDVIEQEWDERND